MTKESPTPGSLKALPNSENIRTLVVDDHAIVRKGLVELLRDEMKLTICADVSNARDALRSVEKHDPDLALVDITLESGNGLDLIKQIRMQNHHMKILVLSMHEEDLYAERALKAGAQGYIMKQAGIEELHRAIKAVVSGQIYVSREFNQRMLNRLHGTKEISNDISPIDMLSNRELEVYEMIGKGLSTRQISVKLGLSIKTIETYRANLKLKLGLESGLELIRSAFDWVNQKALAGEDFRMDSRHRLGRPRKVAE